MYNPTEILSELNWSEESSLSYVECVGLSVLFDFINAGNQPSDFLPCYPQVSTPLACSPPPSLPMPARW